MPGRWGSPTGLLRVSWRQQWQQASRCPCSLPTSQVSLAVWTQVLGWGIHPSFPLSPAKPGTSGCHFSLSLPGADQEQPWGSPAPRSAVDNGGSGQVSPSSTQRQHLGNSCWRAWERSGAPALEGRRCSEVKGGVSLIHRLQKVTRHNCCPGVPPCSRQGTQVEALTTLFSYSCIHPCSHLSGLKQAI